MRCLILLAAATAYHVKEMHTEKVATTYEPDEEIPCPFQQTDDPTWYLPPAKPGAPGPRGRDIAEMFKAGRALPRARGAVGRPGSVSRIPFPCLAPSPSPSPSPSLESNNTQPDQPL